MTEKKPSIRQPQKRIKIKPTKTYQKLLEELSDDDSVEDEWEKSMVIT